MPKVQPPELKKFMDRKLSSKCTCSDGRSLPCSCMHHQPDGRAHARTAANFPPTLCIPRVCAVTLNANRQVTGVLRGFDQFMNLVLDSTVDEKLKQDIGMVVSPFMGSSMMHSRQTHAWDHSRQAPCMPPAAMR